MWSRIKSIFALRQSTGFLLARHDDRLLDDIGLTRAALQTMHLTGQSVPQMQDPHAARQAALLIRRQAA